MKTEQRVILEPEDLSLLGGIYDRVIASLPSRMQTSANRKAVAENLIASAAHGERDPTELELAAFRDLIVVNSAASTLDEKGRRLTLAAPSPEDKSYVLK